MGLHGVFETVSFRLKNVQYQCSSINTKENTVVQLTIKKQEAAQSSAIVHTDLKTRKKRRNMKFNLQNTNKSKKCMTDPSNQPNPM